MTSSTMTIRRVNFKLNPWNFGATVVVLLFLKPAIAEDIKILDFLFNAGRFGLSIIYIGKICFIKKKLPKDWMMLGIIFICNLVSTLVFNGRLSKALTHFIPSLGLLSYVYYNKKRIPELLKIVFKVGLILLIVNFISVILFPNGLLYRASDSLRIWILGQKQDLGGFVIPFLFIALILNKIYKSNLFFWPSYILCITTCFIEKSLGAVLVLVILGFLILLDKYIFKVNIIVLITALIIAFVIIQYVSYNFDSLRWLQRYMESIVTYGVSKLRTLNVRFSMWRFAGDTFRQYPFFGVGKLTPERWVAMSGLSYHSMMDNMYIDMLFTGGIFSFILFIGLILRSFYSMRGCWKDRKVRQMGYCLFSLCVLLFEGCPYFPFVYLMLTFAAWINYTGVRKTSFIMQEEH